MAFSLFNLHAWQTFCTISVQVFFGLPLGLAPSASYSVDFFTQSLSSFRSTCPYHRNLFCCSTEIMSSNPSLSHNPLLGTLSYSFMPSEVSPHFLFLQVTSMQHTQLLSNFPLIVSDMSWLVSSGTNCLNLFHPVRILASTAALASLG